MQGRHVCGPVYMKSESIEWFIKSQAFSRSYDLVPRPLTLTSVSSTGDTQEDREREAVCRWEVGGRGVGEEPNHTTARKLGPL